jgi:hypothetical protein
MFILAMAAPLLAADQAHGKYLNGSSKLSVIFYFFCSHFFIFGSICWNKNFK